jgi:pentatricopeptide repeat domain-containing protein 1
MQASNCKPDVVTYTALVTAYERGGQWMKALEAFRQMQQQGCTADAILYNTLLDVLWDTGIPWAQHEAARLFRTAVDEGHFRKLPLPSASSDTVSVAGDSACGTSDSPTAASAAAAGGNTKLELGMQGMSPGVAMLMLHCWLADLRCGCQPQRVRLSCLDHAGCCPHRH